MFKHRWIWYLVGGFAAWRTVEAYRGQVPLWASMVRPFDTGKSIRFMNLAKHAELCAKQNPDWSAKQCEQKARLSYPPMGIFGTPIGNGAPPDEAGGEMVLGDAQEGSPDGSEE